MCYNDTYGNGCTKHWLYGKYIIYVYFFPFSLLILLLTNKNTNIKQIKAHTHLFCTHFFATTLFSVITNSLPRHAINTWTQNLFFFHFWCCVLSWILEFCFSFSRVFKGLIYFWMWFWSSDLRVSHLSLFLKFYTC